MENQHHPERKNFQIDRMILFTDAVFAIAITLLVIDIKVPIIAKSATETDFINALFKEAPKFLGFVVSFFIIGLYWFLHHKMFGYVINYTSKLIWLNLIFLFSIVLLPFTTSVYSGYSTEEHIQLIGPYALYASNLCFTGVMQFFLLKYIYNPKNGVSSELPSKENQKSTLYRALAIPAIFLASLLLTVVTPLYGRMLLFTIPFFMKMLAPKKEKVPKEKEANT
ncbi:TMEM175 family protein [Soonwooa sp.]|uniref:TMEM175 family protein n=1 Tax=Soonwooa sp. TaxID=1938592 RepID=UPI00260FE1CE|nr:TMEM175 family protein [Soonwooa sp.]